MIATICGKPAVGSGMVKLPGHTITATVRPFVLASRHGAPCA
jgi:hypothetical protein